MSLLTPELIKQLPQLYATEGQEIEDKLAIVKLFHPTSYWTWYIIEFDGKDICFGLVCGHEREYGYFSLSELEAIGKGGMAGVERDLYFKPTPISQLQADG